MFESRHWDESEELKACRVVSGEPDRGSLARDIREWAWHSVCSMSTQRGRSLGWVTWSKRVLPLATGELSCTGFRVRLLAAAVRLHGGTHLQFSGVQAGCLRRKRMRTDCWVNWWTKVLKTHRALGTQSQNEFRIGETKLSLSRQMPEEKLGRALQMVKFF